MSFEHHLVRLFEKPELKTKQDGTPYFTALVSLASTKKILEIACIGDKTESYYYDLLNIKDDFEVFGNNRAGTLWLRGLKTKNTPQQIEQQKREILVFKDTHVEVTYGLATWNEPLERFTNDKTRITDLFADIFKEETFLASKEALKDSKRNRTSYTDALWKKIQEKKSSDSVPPPTW
jgi:hypothetical protein